MDLKNLLNRTDLSIIKTVAIHVMILTHCRFFYSLYFNFQTQLPEHPNLLTMLITLTGLISLCIPVIAGQELYERIKPFVINGKLKGFNKNFLIYFLLIIAFIDPLKSWAAEGLIYAFRWNALPLISTSLILLVFFTNKISIAWTPLIALFILAAGATFRPFIVGAAILLPDDYGKFLNSPSYYISFFTFLLSLFFIFHFLFKKSFKNKNYSLFVILFLCFSALLYKQWQQSPSFAVSIYNLPLATLTFLGRGGGHLWPLFPWSSLVVFGFWFQWLQQKSISSKYNHYLIFSLALIYFSLTFNNFYRSYYNLLDAKSGYSSAIFSLPESSFISLFSLYILVFYFFKLLSSQKLINNRFIKLVSSGILIVYALHYILASLFSPIIAKLGFGHLGYWLYIFLVYAQTLGLSGLLVYLYQSRIKVVFRR